MARLIEAIDVLDEVIVEIELGEVTRDVGREFDARDLILSETEFLEAHSHCQ